ncbi:pentapeptide repeat-containing protein [Streptosporangium fragile]|uniref:Pentapeptide repeat-containing protein n=1 Tax=Streptosporangium fragile TaxID=46186 RepID=A0ABP6IJA2_9ACTN
MTAATFLLFSIPPADRISARIGEFLSPASKDGLINWIKIGVLLLILLVPLTVVLLGPVAHRLSGLPREDPRQDAPGALSAKERVEAVNSTRQMLMQAATGLAFAVGAVFTILGLVYTAQTLATTQESQITDRYTRATQQLDSDKRAVRLSAVYALGRIASDSERDHETVTEVLTAFVREQSEKDRAQREKAARRSSAVPAPSIDIQAAMTVIGDLRRTSEARGTTTRGPNLRGIEVPYVDLRDTYLSVASLSDSDLSNANLENARLNGADLRKVDLTGARLIGADLNSAHLDSARLPEAELIGADLTGADLNGADLRNATLRGADFSGANLENADLTGADLREAVNLTEEQKQEAKSVKDATF